MKKILITIMSLLVAIISIAQVTNVTDFRIANNVTLFGRNIPIGTKVFDENTNKYWVAIAPVPSTETLTSAIASFREVGISGVVDYIQFNNEVTNLSWAEGKIYYDSTKHAFTYYNEVSDVALNISRELVDRNLNNTGSTIPNLTPVYVDGNEWKIADSRSYEKTRNIFIVTHDIPHGTYGYGTVIGEVSGDLTGYNVGDVLYVDGPGTLTTTFPDDGNFVCFVGNVRKTGTDGILLVRTSSSEYTADINKVRGWTDYLQGVKSTFSFNDATRTLTITPVGDEHIYQNGVKYEIDAVKNFQISNVQGLHYTYFDQGIMYELVNPSSAQISDIVRNKVTASVIYWDLANQTAIYVSNERHTIYMPAATQSYLHRTRGTQYGGGLTPLNVGTGSGTVNADAQFGMDAGTIADEDVETSTPVIASTTGLPIYYRTGTNDWKKTVRSGYSFLNDGTTGLVQYNKLTTGTWGLTSMTNNYYGLIHVFATNGIYTQTFAFMGIGEYASITAADVAIGDEITSIKGIGFPFAEAKHIATFIFQTKTAFANSVKMDLVLTPLGNQFRDFRELRDIGVGGTSATTGTFLSLTDTPSSYAGQANKLVKVNGTESGAEFSQITATAGALANVTTINMSGQLTNTQATGTAPFNVSSTTVNTNLNADMVDNLHSTRLENDSVVVSGTTTKTIRVKAKDGTQVTNTFTDLVDDADASTTNEKITSVSYENDMLTIVEGGVTWQTEIISGSGEGAGGYFNTVYEPTANFSFTFPMSFDNTDYFLWLRAYQKEFINGDTVQISIAMKDLVKTVSGFSVETKEDSCWISYLVMDTLDWRLFTFENYVTWADSALSNQMGIVQPGSNLTVSNGVIDTKIASTIQSGTVKVDGTTIIISNGVISAAGSVFGVQTLTGTTPTYNPTNGGIDARITLTGNTTITMSNLVAGQKGMLTVVNGSSPYTLDISQTNYQNDISKVIGNIGNYTRINVTGTIGKRDYYGWYYDGVKVSWRGELDFIGQ